MAVAIIQPSFSAGELSPNLYGRVDLAKFHVGCATMRNFFVNYRGGASSRAGTKFVGSAKQAFGTPPRLIRFQFSLTQGIVLEFGEHYIRFIVNGGYILETTKTITGITQALPGVVTSAAHGFSNGESVYLTDISGMVQLNQNIYTVANATTDTFSLIDLFGNAVNTTNFGAYTGGGTAARVYTISSPYEAIDLPELKFTQSADVMSFAHHLYPPYDLSRISDTNWTMAPTNFSPIIGPPTSLTAKATTTVQGNILFVSVTNGGSGYTVIPRVTITSSTGTGAVLAAIIAGGAVVGITVVASGSGYQASDPVVISSAIGTGATAAANIGPSPVPPTFYSYQVTAVDKTTGRESVGSNIAIAGNSVDIATIAGAIKLQWHRVANAGSYRIYKAPPTFNTAPPVGTLFGYIGTTLGSQFTDNNIVADFTSTPPLYENPFAIGQVLSLTMTNNGSGYTGEPSVGITSGTGSGAVLRAIVLDDNTVDGVLVINPGANYRTGDTVTFTGGAGSNAAATLNVGPITGTYPSVVTYFQQRRVYANTLNQPDTYFMSQPGGFTDFDVATIPLDDNAIQGTPWALQVNGIQQMVPVPTGLITLTGQSAWLVSGGAQQAPITPTNQQATAQAYNGCHDHLPPIQINYDILYVQSKGAIIRDLSYNLWVNIYTGTDISILSDHLFLKHQLLEWTWAEEPHKVVWAVRDDGAMLSLTFVKEQEVSGWARHDTKGLFKSVTSVTEHIVSPTVDTFADVVYVVVQRFVQGQWLYYIERMDPRLWNTLDDSWCLDSALSLPQSTPDAILTASQSQFPGRVSTTVNIVTGGSGYTNPIAIITDPQSKGQGRGAQVILGLTAGVITSATVITQGQDYVAPQITVSDATGQGAVLYLALDNNITFTADADVFGTVGDTIRMGGGQAIITAVNSARQVTADLVVPIRAVVPDDPLQTPVPAQSGQWTLTTPVTTLRGLSHLEGQTISVLADGSVVSDLVVTNGQVELPAPASSIVAGLSYQAQIQSLNTDIPGEATVQGKRKNIYAVTVRVAESRGLKVGSNQPNAAAVGFTQPWTNIVEIKERGNAVDAGTPIPLFTGDERINIPGSWQKGGQVAVQQDYPLPANVLAFIPEEVIGDSNG